MTVRHVTVAFSHTNKSIELNQHIATVRDVFSPLQVLAVGEEEDDGDKSATLYVFLVQGIEDFVAFEQGICKLENEFHYRLHGIKNLNEVLLKRALTDVIKFDAERPGGRVGVILSTSDTEIVMLGYGTYLGNFNPTSEGVDGPNALIPKVRLDSGRIVWGFQMYWGAEELVRNSLEKDRAKGVNITQLTDEEIELRLNGPEPTPTPSDQEVHKDALSSAKLQLLKTIMSETGTLASKIWFRKWCEAYGENLASEMNVLLGISSERTVPLPGDCKMTKLHSHSSLFASMRFAAGLLETDGRCLMVVAVVEGNENIKPLTAADVPWLHISALEAG